MSPSEAISFLLSLPEWTEVRIAEATGTTQPTINRIKRGASPAYDLGVAIVTLAKRQKARAPKSLPDMREAG